MEQLHAREFESPPTWRTKWPAKTSGASLPVTGSPPRTSIYRRPDHPWLLQSYVWQDYDLCPKFPELQRFLDFWKKSLDGPLHSVMVAHSGLIKPAELRAVDGVFRLH